MPDSLQQLRALVDEHDLRVVVSDLDGVLRIFDDSLWERLDAMAGVDPGAAVTAVLRHPYLDEVVRGRGTHAQWRERATDALVERGSTLTAAQDAVRVWAGTPGAVDPEVLDLLRVFRDRGLGVFVLTNGTDRVPQELEEIGLTDLLGEGRRYLLNTADLGAAKPDPDAYARAHARIEQELAMVLTPDQVVFLDDSASHVHGAAEFGWHAVHHRPV